MTLLSLKDDDPARHGAHFPDMTANVGPSAQSGSSSGHGHYASAGAGFTTHIHLHLSYVPSTNIIPLIVY